MQGMLKERTCRGLLVVGLALGAALNAGTGLAGEAVDLAAVDRDLAEFRARLERLRGTVETASFDPESRVDHLDYDADAILEFVVSEVVFQPYEGTLRGVTGTLRAAAGNSLDQSILLASMLKSAGYDARVARGRLAEGDAVELLRQTAGATPTTDLDYLQPSLEAVFPGASGSEHELDVDSTQAAANAREQSKTLLQALASADIDLKTHDATARWQSVAQQYFWVQHRDGVADGWQDAHPAFDSTAPPPSVAAEGYFADSVPTEYHHTFTLQAWIESYQSGEIKRQALMSPWTVPVANYAGTAIRYRNAANGFVPDTAGDLAKALSQTSFFTPALNGSSAPGAQAFDLKGRVIDPFALGSPAAALFQTLGDKMISATEGVQDDEDGQPLLALHSLWLEFTHTAPSGITRTQRRYLVPPRADYAGDPLALAWPLITDHTYLLTTGGQPLDLLADRYLHTAAEDMDWIRVMVHKMLAPESRQPVPEDLPAEFPSLVQYWLMDHGPALHGEKEVIAYRAEPGLLGLRRGFRDAGTAFLGVDVVWNGVEHVRTTSQGLEQLPQASLARGAWDTALESVPARVQGLDSSSAVSAIRVMQLADEQSLTLQVLTPAASADLASFGLDTAAQSFLQSDLDSGYAVVLPERVPTGAKTGAWWRVHPRTGETLGMTADGYGAESVEYAIDMAMTYNSLGAALNNLEECRTQPTMDTRLCCLMEANINNVAGLSFGGILGATTGTAGSVVFELMNGDPENPIMPSADAGCDRLPATEW